MITKIENFINEKQLVSLRNLTKGELPSRPGVETAGDAIKADKKSTIYDDVTWPGSGSVNSIKRRKIHDIIFRREDLVEQVVEKVTCGEFDNLFSSIAVYNVGDFYDWHLDRLTTGQGRVIDISYTVFLNDPEDYEGGTLRVEHDYGISSFKEEAGTAVFYPSACLHRVDQVLSGSRMVVLGLINCTVPLSHDRHILTELSNCINGIDDYSSSLANAMINSGEIDDINRRLHYVQMQLKKRFMRH